MRLRVFSTCSGISAASVAWKRLGFEFVAFAEVAPFPCHVLAGRRGATAPRYLPQGFKRSDYKDIHGGSVPNFGDLTAITDADLEALGRVDVLEGGPPCQTFSIAGLRGGLTDQRGMVTLHFVGLAHRMRRINGLKYIIWENVHGILGHPENPFGHFLAALGAVGGMPERPLVPPDSGWSNAGHLLAPAGAFAWRTLDAQHWGVPQRRKRVFLVGCFGAAGPCPLEILGEHGARAGGSGSRGETKGENRTIRDPGAAGGSAEGGARAIGYIGGQGADAGSIGASETTAPTLKAANSGSSRTPFVAQLFDRQAINYYKDSGVSSTLRSNTSAGYDHDLVVHPRTIGTLTASGAGPARASGLANEADFCIVHPSQQPGRKNLVRRLMPVECERLQGFPDGWTDIPFRGKEHAADTNRYGAIGNSMAVPCMRYIGEKLLAAHLDEDSYTDYGFSAAPEATDQEATDLPTNSKLADCADEAAAEYDAEDLPAQDGAGGGGVEPPGRGPDGVEDGESEREPMFVPTAGPLEQQERMRRAGALIEKKLRVIAEANLAIADELAAARAVVPVTKLRTFLVAESRLARGDVGAYLKVAETLGEHREVMARRAVSFPALKALAAAPEAVRRDAVARIDSGSTIHARDVTALKRRFVEQAEGPEAAAERKRRKALRSAAQKRAQTDLEAFASEFSAFAGTLVGFYGAGLDGTVTRETYDATRASLIADAARCLPRFEALFDTAALPDPWEHDRHDSPDEAVRLARAHEGLKSLAAGELQVIDPDSGNPQDKDHDFLDCWIVESVAWLLNGGGVSVERLKRPKASAVPAVPKAVTPPYRLSSLEICAGAGGQALGLHAAGFDSLLLYEQDQYAAATLEANAALGLVRNEDITKVNFSRLRGGVDLVAGGVPCQPHSSQGKRQHGEDERDLFPEAVRIVDEVRPRAFFFENVAGFGDGGNISQRTDLYRQFQALGYESRLFSVCGSDLGLPQKRVRTAFIGFRDVPIQSFRMPPKLPNLKTTVGEGLLDVVAARGWEGAWEWARTKGDRFSPAIIGASPNSGRYGFAGPTMMGRWKPLGIDAEEITQDAPPRDHPIGADFRLTLEMGARLQGFPDEWRFQGPPQPRGRVRRQEKHAKRQIANALPPVMARAIGLSIYSALTGVEFDYEAALRLPLTIPRATGLKLAVARRVQEHFRRKSGLDDDGAYCWPPEADPGIPASHSRAQASTNEGPFV